MPRTPASRPALPRLVRAARAVGAAILLAVASAPARAADHAAFDALLRAHVVSGDVRYAGFAESPDFANYVADLARPVPLNGRAETLAYYINAYNALAIAGIVEGLSPSTLLGRVRYFKFRDWPLNGTAVNLYDLEHKVIRPLGEPRIHFAIVCASKSCPPLRPEAYTAARLDAQLDAQARAFVNDPVRNRYDKAARIAHLSEIFKWFAEDFAGPAGSVQKYVARYVADPDVARALADDGYEVRWIDYDWTLNGTPPRRQAPPPAR